jgi:hypothetical protein
MLAVETIARIRREHFIKGEAYWHRRFADPRAAGFRFSSRTHVPFWLTPGSAAKEYKLLP